MGDYSWRFFFALFSLTRFSVNISVLERPMVVGFFISIITGQVFPVMYIAFFFELLWIDLIPAGTFIPPNAIFCMLATITVTHLFNLEYASQIFPVMLATIPIAFLISWLEGVQRTAQNRNYNTILQQSRKNALDFQPGLMAGYSILQLLLIYLIVGVAGIYGLFLLMDLFHSYLPAGDYPSWTHLLMIASISALAALRIRKAYVSLILGIIMISVYFALELAGVW
jgi:mannose PTS system EIIC component